MRRPVQLFPVFVVAFGRVRAGRRAGERSYLEMTKRRSLDLRLELRHTILLDSICSEWAGVKSVYAVRRHARSRVSR